jgi:hypothetical protein
MKILANTILHRKLSTNHKCARAQLAPTISQMVAVMRQAVVTDLKAAKYSIISDWSDAQWPEIPLWSET